MQRVLLFWICASISLITMCSAGAQTQAVTQKEAEASTWTIHYTVPEGVKKMTFTLAYGYWDPKIDGDVPSKKILLTAQVDVPAQAQTLDLHFALTGKSSSLSVADRHSALLFHGKGYLLTTSYQRATAPKPNADGFYILAQKPADPKNPAPIGETMEASSWIELGIDLQP